MADLSIVIGSVALKNPIILASGTPGWNGTFLKKGADAGAGAVVTKTIGTSDEPVMHPHCGRYKLIKSGKKAVGMINTELSSVISKEGWLTKELQLARQKDSKLFASVLAQPLSTGTERLVDEVAATGFVDMIELNVSAPIAGGKMGARIGQEPSLVFEAVKAAKNAAAIPVTVKLTPNVSDVVQVAKAAAAAGAEGIVISNSIMGFAGVDIRSGLPVLPAFGGYTGPAVKPIISKLVAEVCMHTDVPVIAVGGVSSWEDVVEYIMLGATAVQICTSVMWKGYGVIEDLIQGVENFMISEDHSTLEKIRGTTLKHIISIAEYAKQPGKYARIDADLCLDCGKCAKVCFFDAVKREENMMKVDRNACDGCGMCVQWCPEAAIELVG